MRAAVVGDLDDPHSVPWVDSVGRHLGQSGGCEQGAVEERGGEAEQVGCGRHEGTGGLRAGFEGGVGDPGERVGAQVIQRALRHENVGTTDKYLAKRPARTVAITEEFRLGL